MDASTTVADKHFNAEKHRLIAEALLRGYALFLDRPRPPSPSTQLDDATPPLLSLDCAPLSAHPSETASLTRSDNANLARIARSLLATLDEIDALKAGFEAVYEGFLSYDEGGEVVGRVEALLEVEGLVRRSREVVVVTLRQVCALSGKRASTQTVTMFPEVLSSLGDLFICLMKMDHLLDSKVLREHWRLYRNSVKSLIRSGGREIDGRRLKSFDGILSRLENELLPCAILKNVLRGSWDDQRLSKHGLSVEIGAYLTELAGRLEGSFEPDHWFKLNIFAAFHPVGLDRKLLRRIVELNKRFSACELMGNIVWYPERFLSKHSSLQVDEKSARNQRNALAQKIEASYAREVIGMCAQTMECLMEVERVCKGNMGSLQAKQLQDATNLFTRVLKLAKNLRRSIGWVLNLHSDNDLPITKSVLLSVCKLIESLKCIQSTFQRNSISISHLLLLIRQQLQHRSLTLLSNIHKTLIRERSYKSHHLDSLSAVSMCERALRRMDSCAHAQSVAALALSAGGIGGGELRAALGQLGKFRVYSEEIGEAVGCETLFWHVGYVLPAYLGGLVRGRGDVGRYGLVVGAMGEYRGGDGAAYRSTLDRIISDSLYRPLAQLVESNLRLQTHQHLHLPSVDPFDTYHPLNFLKYDPIHLYGSYKSVRDDVEHQLSETFYNLTSVVLYDWRVYGEMRKLGEVEYGLVTVGDDLPMQTLEQGLDVLEVMRNIDVFVAKYSYNLNSQVFIERKSDGKHLNSIGITHVTNSIRTHGTGIMNTTVNFTYQFLRSKFQILSQFIFDEQIKSRLLQDRKYFTQSKTDQDLYPYQRAEKFNVGIRRLGLNESGESYLDLFRGVVTEIGNAMGYVRLIRSGGRRCLAEGASFVPDLEKIHDITVEPGMPDLSVRSVSQLIDNLESITANIDESTEYFKLLVDVFVPVLRSKTNQHLRYFHLIVPPLTVNYVEHMLNCKERLNKRNSGYTFTDDGFALGLAYVVEVLDQGDDLGALHWFRSVERKLEGDRRGIEEQLGADSNDDKLKQALNLSMRKVRASEREFRLLYYGFNSARLFFQNGND